MLFGERRHKHQEIYDNASNSVVDNKNVILAVLMNYYTAGFGQLFLGYYWTGTIFMGIVIIMSYFTPLLEQYLGIIGINYAISPSLNFLIQGLLFLIVTFDLILRFNHYNKNVQIVESSDKKSKIKALVMNIIFPGNGLFYYGFKKIALLLIMVSPFIIQLLFQPCQTYEQALGLYILFGILLTIPVLFKRKPKSSETIETEKIFNNNIFENFTNSKGVMTFFTIIKYIIYAATLYFAYYLFNVFIPSMPSEDLTFTFILIIIIKAYMVNIQLIKGEWEKNKFDLSVIFTLLVLFSMGFQYALVLLTIDAILGSLVKLIYIKDKDYRFLDTVKDVIKHIFALSTAFLVSIVLNPSQEFSFDNTQIMVLVTAIYVICLLLWDLKNSKGTSFLDAMVSWFFYMLVLIVFVLAFLSIIITFKIHSIYVLSLIIFIIQFLVEIQQEFLKSKLKIMEMGIKIFKDELTGAYNIRYLNNMIDELKNTSEPYSLIMLDIDNFKKLNDSYGHQTGDRGLKHIVNVILNSIREETDLVFRYGGEEFVVILKDTSKTNAIILAERIRRQLEITPFMSQSESRESLYITASFGIADYQSGEDVIKIADENMYKAKDQGKNRAIA